MTEPDPIAAAADALLAQHRTSASIEDRTIRVDQMVRGDPGLTVLRVLGLAQDAPAVGAAAHGPTGVAIGVWRRPEMYVARWTKGRRWVVGYRISDDAKPNAY